MSKGQKALLLIDAISDHYVDHGAFVAMVTGLLAAVYRLTTPNTAIWLSVKCFVPVEVRSKVAIKDWDKMEARACYLGWSRNGDLFELLSRRFHHALVKTGQLLASASFLDAFGSVLPLSLVNRQGHAEWTIDYLVRHTQSKPRELIFLVKTLLQEAQKRRVGEISNALIVEVVHHTTLSFVRGILAAYQDVYPNANYWIQTLHGDRNIMTCTELRQRLKRAQKYFSEDDRTMDVVNYLIDMGVIGVVKQRESCGQVMRVLAEFKYVADDEVLVLGDEEVVVHPLFYKQFFVKAETNTIVQPATALWRAQLPSLASSAKGTG